jgi:hypothetical protein
VNGTGIHPLAVLFSPHDAASGRSHGAPRPPVNMSKPVPRAPRSTEDLIRYADAGGRTRIDEVGKPNDCGGTNLKCGW